MIGAGRLRQRQAGFTLVELLVAMTLALLVIGAALTSLTTMQTGARLSNDQTEANDRARSALDRLARGLRDDGGTTPIGDGVEKAAPNDLVVLGPAVRRTAGSNPRAMERIRYCLDTTARVLRRQVQTWAGATPPASPPTSSCDGTGWPSSDIVAHGLVNDAATPLFAYPPQAAGAMPPDLAAVTTIQARLRIDVDPTQRPQASDVRSEVALRNHNRAPVAAFDVVTTANRGVTLLAATSVDPELRPLVYIWRDETAGAVLVSCDNRATCTTTAPAGGSRTYRLTVTDSGDLSATTTRAVSIGGDGDSDSD